MRCQVRVLLRTSRLTTCTGRVHPSTLTPAGIFVEPRRRGHGRSKTQRKIIRADLLLGVDLVESMRREVFDEIRQGLFVLFFFLLSHSDIPSNLLYMGFPVKRQISLLGFQYNNTNFILTHYSTFTYYRSLKIEKLLKFVFLVQIGSSQDAEVGKSDFDSLCFAYLYAKLFART